MMRSATKSMLRGLYRFTLPVGRRAHQAQVAAVEAQANRCVVCGRAKRLQHLPALVHGVVAGPEDEQAKPPILRHGGLCVRPQRANCLNSLDFLSQQKAKPPPTAEN